MDKDKSVQSKKNAISKSTSPVKTNKIKLSTKQPNRPRRSVSSGKR